LEQDIAIGQQMQIVQVGRLGLPLNLGLFIQNCDDLFGILRAGIWAKRSAE
jgi:hypothetical protein